MRAIRVTRAGGPEVLEVASVEVPEPLPGQVVVEQSYAGVNFIDIYHREGVYPLPLPATIGSEGAGTIASVGPGVSGFATGDRVAYTGVLGTYAEYCAVPEDKLVKIPDGISDQVAAAAMLQGMTAQFLTESCYPVKRDDVVVVHAAAGGVGSLVTQLASRKLGAKVVATTSTAAKAELARSFGASFVEEYGTFVARAHELGGAHVVYDGVGKATFDNSLTALRRRGMMVLFGGASGQVPPFDLQRLNALGSLYVTRPTLFHYIADRNELLARAASVFDSIASGDLTIRIGGVYPLAEVHQAQRDLASRGTTGKLLISVAS